MEQKNLSIGEKIKAFFEGPFCCKSNEASQKEKKTEGFKGIIISYEEKTTEKRLVQSFEEKKSENEPKKHQKESKIRSPSGSFGILSIRKVRNIEEDSCPPVIAPPNGIENELMTPEFNGANLQLTPQFGGKEIKSETGRSMTEMRYVPKNSGLKLKRLGKNSKEKTKGEGVSQIRTLVQRRSLDHIHPEQKQKFALLQREKREKVLKDEPRRIKEIINDYDQWITPKAIAGNEHLNRIKKDLIEASKKRGLVTEKYRQSWSPKRKTNKTE